MRTSTRSWRRWKRQTGSSAGDESEARDEMVVHHPRGLHEAVADGRSHEAEASCGKPTAHRAGLGRRGRYVRHPRPGVDDGPPACEPPDVGDETAGGLRHVEGLPGVRHGRFDSLPVAHDAGTDEQAFDARRCEARDALRIEPVEEDPIPCPLPQDRDPAEARLGALEHEHLEQPPVVVHRRALFVVGVFEIEGIGPGPLAAAGFAHGVAKSERPAAGRRPASPALSSRGCLRNMRLSISRPGEAWPHRLQRTNIRASSDVIE